MTTQTPTTRTTPRYAPAVAVAVIVAIIAAALAAGLLVGGSSDAADATPLDAVAATITDTSISDAPTDGETGTKAEQFAQAAEPHASTESETSADEAAPEAEAPADQADPQVEAAPASDAEEPAPATDQAAPTSDTTAGATVDTDTETNVDAAAPIQAAPVPFQATCSTSKSTVAVGETFTISGTHQPHSMSVTWSFSHGDGYIDHL